MRKRLLAMCLGAVLIGGCAGQRGPTMAPQVPLAEQSAPAVQPQVDETTPQPSVGSITPVLEQPVTQAPKDVQLVPMDPSWRLQMRLLHPEGWSEVVTAHHEGVQSLGPAHQLIHVMTYQMRDEKAPLTVEQMLQYVASWAPNATARQLRLDGTVSAFEVRYNQGGGETEESVLEYYMFGTTFKQILSFSAATPLFSEWEPVFRKIQAAFVPSNLDADPLPSQP